jgi:cytochrome c
MRIAFLAAALLAVAASPPAMAQSAADPAAGERVFVQCRACHQVGETARNTVGPQLNGLFGRKAGAVPGYNYSPAYQRPEVAEKIWSEENFTAYIRNPMSVTPGTRMVFAGLRSDTQIANLIAYLKQFDAEGKRPQ